MRISDWSSDVGSSDLPVSGRVQTAEAQGKLPSWQMAITGPLRRNSRDDRQALWVPAPTATAARRRHLFLVVEGCRRALHALPPTGSASCREGMCQYA